MMMRYRIAPGYRVHATGDDVFIDTGYGEIRITSPSPAQRDVLARLASGTCSDAELTHQVAAVDGGIAWLEMTLAQLFDLGVVVRIVGDPVLFELVMIGRSADGGAINLAPDTAVRLSRHAYLRQVDERLVVESPRSAGRLTLVHEQAGAIMMNLAAGTSLGELRDAHREPTNAVDSEALEYLVAQMVALRMLEPTAPPSGSHPVAQALTEWSFHDLLFHSRARSGRHNLPYGAFYPWEGRRAPLPAVRERYAGDVIELPTVALTDLVAQDRPFTEVLENRQSWRRPGPEPLTIAQLGEFLQRSSRVRGRRGTEHEEVSNRPYPGGGADYELEIYVLAHRVSGLDPALYHYDPLTHGLVLVHPDGPDCERLLVGVAQKLDSAAIPDLALFVTARIQRLTYKYESIPYSIALKDLGALYATWYLVATAMDLAPCAVGGGDFDSLAALTGVSPYLEPHIGEFVLNTQDPTERHLPPPVDSIRRAREALASSTGTST